MSGATDEIAVLILAAGSSRRLGRPKALLPDGHGSNLVRRVVNTAVKFGATAVYVVVQPDDDGIGATLEGTPVEFVPNPDWPEGMASSLRAGITQIRKTGRFDAVLILLLDQPELTAGVLRSMQATFDRGRRVVACRYGDVIGVPALIGAEFFSELLQLSGDRGARDWLRDDPGRVATVPFPGGARDIDYSADSGRHEPKTSDPRDR